MKDPAKQYLMSLEILREFVRKVVPPETYLKNLIIDGIDTPNKRLWILREFLKIDERAFAERLGIDYNQYHQLERIGNPVPVEVLDRVSETSNIPLDWLHCKMPIYPIPVS